MEMTDRATVDEMAHVFPSRIHSGDWSISNEQIIRALKKWGPRRGYISLGFIIDDQSDVACPETRDVFRVADRIIQRLRKAGYLRLGPKRKWEWVE
jgi:hypothetical protein